MPNFGSRFAPIVRVVPLGAVLLAVVLLAVVPLAVVTASARADVPAKLVTGAMANFTVSKPLAPAPDVRFVDGDGKPTSLADFRGKLVLVNFWATWCAPCRREMAEFDHLQAELGGEDFVIVAISADRKGPEVIPPFYKENGIKHLGVYNDKSMKTHRAFRVPGLPTTVLIDAEGNLIGRLIGPAEWASPEALALVKHLIAESVRGKSPAQKAAAK